MLKSPACTTSPAKSVPGSIGLATRLSTVTKPEVVQVRGSWSLQWYYKGLLQLLSRSSKVLVPLAKMTNFIGTRRCNTILADEVNAGALGTKTLLVHWWSNHLEGLLKEATFSTRI